MGLCKVKQMMAIINIVKFRFYFLILLYPFQYTVGDMYKMYKDFEYFS